jgi:hypothetical protein
MFCVRRKCACGVITMESPVADTRTADHGRETASVLLDRRYFALDADTFERFTAMLDAPPATNPKLRCLLVDKAPWERSGTDS